jgi:hypothetical protein
MPEAIEEEKEKEPSDEEQEPQALNTLQPSSLVDPI